MRKSNREQLTRDWMGITEPDVAALVKKGGVVVVEMLILARVGFHSFAWMRKGRTSEKRTQGVIKVPQLTRPKSPPLHFDTLALGSVVMVTKALLSICLRPNQPPPLPPNEFNN